MMMMMMMVMSVVMVTYLRAASIATRDVAGDAAWADSELGLTTADHDDDAAKT